MNLLRRLVPAALIAGVVIASAATLLGQDLALRYRWAKGGELRYRVTTESTVVMSGLPGMGEMTVTTTQGQVQQLRTTEVAADGTATVLTRFESVRMEVASPAGRFSYDSTKPAAQGGDPVTGLIAKTMGALVGETITVVMAPDGAIRSVQGATKLMEKIKGTLPADAVSAMSGLGGGFETMMNDEAMRSSFGQSFANLPSKAVKPGDTWQSEIKLPNPMGEMVVSTSLTFKGTERLGARDVARIAFTQRLKAGAGGAMGPMTVQLGDGTGDGEIVFDHKQGLIVRSVARNTIPMTMSMTGPDGSSMNIQGVTKTTMTMELVEK